MSFCDDRQWMRARLEKTEALIVQVEDAILQLSTGAIQSYSLDTGQSRSSYTKQSIGQLKNLLSALENRRAAYRSRLGCGGSKQLAPGW